MSGASERTQRATERPVNNANVCDQRHVLVSSSPVYRRGVSLNGCSWSASLYFITCIGHSPICQSENSGHYYIWLRTVPTLGLESHRKRRFLCSPLFPHVSLSPCLCVSLSFCLFVFLLAVSFSFCFSFSRRHSTNYNDSAQMHEE